jgi:hypothetical protein
MNLQHEFQVINLKLFRVYETIGVKNIAEMKVCSVALISCRVVQKFVTGLEPN